MVFCLAVCLTVLFAPILLEISPDGKTYAFSSNSNNKKSKATGEFSAPGYTMPNNDNPVPVRLFEPRTFLLVVTGVAFLVAFRKKFKKK
jgi:hypothetical protein